MEALMPTPSATRSHPHPLLHSFVSGFNTLLKYEALSAILLSHMHVVKVIFENMIRVLEEHKEASKKDDRSRRYNAEVQLALDLALIQIKLLESKRL